ncbi:unnamed protein product [Brassica rapa subsp. trilocularis]
MSKESYLKAEMLAEQGNYKFVKRKEVFIYHNCYCEPKPQLTMAEKINWLITSSQTSHEMRRENNSKQLHYTPLESLLRNEDSHHVYT